MNFKTVKSWPQVRQALCELSQCVKNAGGPIESIDSGLRIDEGVLNLGAATSGLDVEGILKSNTYFTLTDPVLGESYVSIFLGNGRFGGALLTLTSENLVTGEYSQISFTPKSLGLTVRDTNEDIISLALTVDSGASITDDIFSKGLHYNSDYSAAQIGDNDIPSIKRVKQLQGTLRPIIEISSSSPATTATKIASTGEGYVPQVGDIVYLTLSNANTANNPSVNIDGSGAKAIQVGGQNPTNIAVRGTKLLMWYDGTAFQLFGSTSVTDNNTTYSEISTANIKNPTNGSTGLISGRRFADGISEYVADQFLIKPSPYVVDIRSGNVTAFRFDLMSGSNGITFTNFPGPLDKVRRFSVLFVQPDSGDPGTVNVGIAGGNMMVPNGDFPTLSTTNNAIDLLEFLYLPDTSLILTNYKLNLVDW